MLRLLDFARLASLDVGVKNLAIVLRYYMPVGYISWYKSLRGKNVYQLKSFFVTSGYSDAPLAFQKPLVIKGGFFVIRLLVN
jgi:hypothetical protein